MTNLFNSANRERGVFAALTIFLFSIFLFSDFQLTVKAQNVTAENSFHAGLGESSQFASPNIVVSQFYGGGGQAGAPYKNDFVELLNRGTTAVNINGWSLQYASDGGSSWLVTNLPNATIQPGQYFLIQFGSNGSVGADLPQPDYIAPLVTGRTFVLNLATASAKFAVVNTTTQLPASTCPITDSSIVDFVGYGDSASCSETARTPNLSISTGGKRNGNGCQDTDNNANDFTIGAPAPRNSQSAIVNCGNPASNLTASGAANPGTAAPGGSVKLTVRVFPATEPPSTNITVTGNLTAIGGSANQQFFDDGTNGDATANDNVFTFQANVPNNQAGGSVSIQTTVADAQNRTANPTIIFSVLGSVAQVHLTMGNPTGATSDVNNPFNYLLLKNQYALSYHRDRGIPNWASWHLDSSWIGGSGRQDDFRPDPTLPEGWYQVIPDDYSNSGFDRGHHTPSGDRTSTVENNSATFLMTNIMPQAGGNNQGPWNDLENYSRSLVSQGNELYIVAGGTGIGGYATTGNTVTNTIGNGRVTVPALTWKVIIVLQAGTNDVARVDLNTRTIAVIMPNRESIRLDDWQKYIATVDQVEALTGYDFFSNVPAAIQNQIESRLDGSAAAIQGGSYTNLTVSAMNMNLNGNVTVTGNLNLGGNTLHTNGFKITLAPGATVTQNGGYVIGQVEKQFDTNGASFVYPVGTANGYSPVTANLTALGSSPSSLTVSAFQTAHPNAPEPSRALQRYWQLTENGDLTVNLVFQYLDADVPVGISESSFRLNRYNGSFTEIPSTVNAAANTISTSNISQFSDWTAFAQLAPTAGSVAVAGRVLNERGRGVANARVWLTDANGETRTISTNQLGYYRFEEVSVGNTYVFSVFSKRYLFMPQTVNVTEQTNELNFIALTDEPKPQN